MNYYYVISVILFVRKGFCESVAEHVSIKSDAANTKQEIHNHIMEGETTIDSKSFQINADGKTILDNVTKFAKSTATTFVHQNQEINKEIVNYADTHKYLDQEPNNDTTKTHRLDSLIPFYNSTIFSRNEIQSETDISNTKPNHLPTMSKFPELQHVTLKVIPQEEKINFENTYTNALNVDLDSNLSRAVTQNSTNETNLNLDVYIPKPFKSKTKQKLQRSMKKKSIKKSLSTSNEESSMALKKPKLKNFHKKKSYKNIVKSMGKTKNISKSSKKIAKFKNKDKALSIYSKRFKPARDISASNSADDMSLRNYKQVPNVKKGIFFPENKALNKYNNDPVRHHNSDNILKYSQESNKEENKHSSENFIMDLGSIANDILKEEIPQNFTSNYDDILSLDLQKVDDKLSVLDIEESIDGLVNPKILKTLNIVPTPKRNNNFKNLRHFNTPQKTDKFRSVPQHKVFPVNTINRNIRKPMKYRSLSFKNAPKWK